MRLFVALDLPNPIKDRLYALRDEKLPGARWTKAPQWHITLHFIGDCEDDAAIRASLATVSAEPFQMRLAGVGQFPPKGKPRVLWAGIDAPDSLQILHRAVGDALKTTGYEPETRPYSPHMTLARFQDRTPNHDQMQAFVTTHESFETSYFAITHFTLYESQLQRGGAVYTVRARFPAASA